MNMTCQEFKKVLLIAHVQVGLISLRKFQHPTLVHFPEVKVDVLVAVVIEQSIFWMV